jgi:hypothetical protein
MKIMTKKMTVVCIAILVAALVFCFGVNAEAATQFKPCVWPNTCG